MSPPLCLCWIIIYDCWRQLWKRIWSSTHGPVHYFEPELAERALDNWRKSILGEPFNDEPIFLAVKSQQKVFNGYGAQEGCDALFHAFIHPGMPVTLVCRSDELWARFRRTIIDYQKILIQRLHSHPFLPYVSGPKAFRMNTNGHKNFIATVLCYRRKSIYADQQWLDRAHSMGLLDADAIIQDDGTALGTFYRDPHLR